MSIDWLASIVPTPTQFDKSLRDRFGVNEADEVRVSYVAGPGDVVGTYDYMCEGVHDPRAVSIAFSLMFYSVLAQGRAHGQVIHCHPKSPKEANKYGRVDFVQAVPRDYRGRFSYFLSRFLYGLDIVKKIEKFDPHVVVVFGDVPVFILNKLSKGRFLVLEMHNTFWPKGKRPKGIFKNIKLSLIKRSLRWVDDATCTSKECQSQLKELTSGRVEGRVHYPQLAEPQNFKLRNRAKKFIFLGRLEENKGISVLLSAFIQAQKIIDDIQLVIVGAGSYEQALKSKLKNIKNSHISYLGQLHSSEVHKELSTSDVLICPTTSEFNEGLALVVFEALGHGVPSIMSSVVPANETIGNKCIVFQVDDSENLAEKILELAQDDALYQSLSESLRSEKSKLYDRHLSLGACLVDVLLRKERG